MNSKDEFIVDELSAIKNAVIAYRKWTPLDKLKGGCPIKIEGVNYARRKR